MATKRKAASTGSTGSAQATTGSAQAKPPAATPQPALELETAVINPPDTSTGSVPAEVPAETVEAAEEATAVAETPAGPTSMLRQFVEAVGEGFVEGVAAGMGTAPVIPPDTLVVVRLDGAPTAMLGGKAMLRGEARTVTYATLCEALGHHPGRFSVKYPHSSKFVQA